MYILSVFFAVCDLVCYHQSSDFPTSTDTTVVYIDNHYKIR